MDMTEYFTAPLLRIRTIRNRYTEFLGEDILKNIQSLNGLLEPIEQNLAHCKKQSSYFCLDDRAFDDPAKLTSNFTNPYKLYSSTLDHLITIIAETDELLSQSYFPLPLQLRSTPIPLKILDACIRDEWNLSRNLEPYLKIVPSTLVGEDLKAAFFAQNAEDHKAIEHASYTPLDLRKQKEGAAVVAPSHDAENSDPIVDVWRLFYRSSQRQENRQLGDVEQAWINVKASGR